MLIEKYIQICFIKEKFNRKLEKHSFRYRFPFFIRIRDTMRQTQYTGPLFVKVYIQKSKSEIKINCKRNIYDAKIYIKYIAHTFSIWNNIISMSWIIFIFTFKNLWIYTTFGTSFATMSNTIFCSFLSTKV